MDRKTGKDATYSSIRVTVTLNLGDVGLKDSRGHLLAGSLHAKVPELLMVLAEENNGTGGLDAEGRGSVLDCMFDNRKNTLVGDVGLLGKGDSRSTEFDGVEEGSLVRHACGVVDCEVCEKLL